MSLTQLLAASQTNIPELKAWWQQRPLESHYPLVWLDPIHYKVKDNGRYVSKAVYTILGFNIEGQKELPSQLSPNMSESEGANYWLSVFVNAIPNPQLFAAD
jgi:putative transposase